MKLQKGYMPTSLFLVRKAYTIYAKEEAPPVEFFDELIGHAKLIQELISALGVMLEEVQQNLDLLPKES